MDDSKGLTGQQTYLISGIPGAHNAYEDNGTRCKVEVLPGARLFIPFVDN